MPGSSLWLVPPPAHPLHDVLTRLIGTTLPQRFPREAAGSPEVSPHFFAAHLTLTSEVDPARYGDDPQGWLDGLVGEFRRRGRAAPARARARARVRVRFERLVSQDVFFRRCYLRAGFDGVRDLAGLARAKAVFGEEVVEGGGTAGEEEEEEEEEEGGRLRFGERTEEWLRWWRKEYGPHVSLMYGGVPIGEHTLREITKVVQEAGVKLSDEESDAGEWDGWDGGVVWLVPTDKPLTEWKPIATCEL